MTAKEYIEKIVRIKQDQFAYACGPFAAEVEMARILTDNWKLMPAPFKSNFCHGVGVFGSAFGRFPSIEDKFNQDELRMEKIRKAKELISSIKIKYETDKWLVESFMHELQFESSINHLDLCCGIAVDCSFISLREDLITWSENHGIGIDESSAVLTPISSACKNYFGNHIVSHYLVANLCAPHFLIVPREIADEWFDDLFAPFPDISYVEYVKENDRGILVKMSYRMRNIRLEHLDESPRDDYSRIAFVNNECTKNIEAKYCFSLVPSHYSCFSDREYANIETVVRSLNNLPKTGEFNAIAILIDDNGHPMSSPRYCQNYSAVHKWLDDVKLERLSSILIIQDKSLSNKDYSKIIGAIESVPNWRSVLDIDKLCYWCRHVDIDTDEKTILDASIASEMLVRILDKIESITVPEDLLNTRTKTIGDFRRRLEAGNMSNNVHSLAEELWRLNKIAKVGGEGFLNEEKESLSRMISVDRKRFSPKQRANIIQLLYLTALDCPEGYDDKVSKRKSWINKNYSKDD